MCTTWVNRVRELRVNLERRVRRVGRRRGARFGDRDCVVRRSTCAGTVSDASMRLARRKGLLPSTWLMLAGLLVTSTMLMLVARKGPEPSGHGGKGGGQGVNGGDAQKLAYEDKGGATLHTKSAGAEGVEEWRWQRYKNEVMQQERQQSNAALKKSHAYSAGDTFAQGETEIGWKADRTAGDDHLEGFSNMENHNRDELTKQHDTKQQGWSREQEGFGSRFQLQEGLAFNHSEIQTTEHDDPDFNVNWKGSNLSTDSDHDPRQLEKHESAYHGTQKYNESDSRQAEHTEGAQHEKPDAPPPPTASEIIRLQFSNFLHDDEWHSEVTKIHDEANKDRMFDTLDPFADRMDELESIPHRVSFTNQLKKIVNPTPHTRVCFVTVTSANLMGVRQELLPWIQYHTEIGVEKFYLFYDGSDTKALEVLDSIDVVKVIPIRVPLVDETLKHQLERWSKWHRQWGHRPGNYELMVKQTFAITLAIQLAREENMDWIMHIDPDELFVAESESSYSIADVLGRQHPYVSSVRFMNNEATPEYEMIKNRFDEVSLFRVHKNFLTSSANLQRAKARLGDNRSYLNLYVNGKSAARVDAPGLRQVGPHMFRGDASQRWVTPDNMRGEWRDIISNTSVVLHYAYCQESDIVAKAERSCPPEYRMAAVAGDRNKTKDCFVLDFDQDAYHVAATGDPEAVRKFFLSRMVMQQGAALRCAVNDQKGFCLLEDIEEYKSTLLRYGLLKRYHFPHHVLRSQERSIRAMMSPSASSGRV